MNNHVTSSNISSPGAVSGYAVTQLANDFRWKTYKPGGNFTITTSNNTLYINDGLNKTVTMTSGNYTYSTLASHAQTQLNASSSGWTVSYSTTTGKFTFARSSGTLRFTQTSSAAWSTFGFADTVDTAGTSWTSSTNINHTDEWILIDLGAPYAVTAACLISLQGEDFPISQGATFKIQGNNLNVWTAPTLNVSMTWSDLGGFKFLDDQSDYTFRYWRFYWTDKQNGLGPTGFQFSHIYLGDYTTLTNRNVASGFSKSHEDPVDIQESDGGAEFFNLRTKYQTIENLTLPYLDASERRQLEQDYFEYGLSKPFYVSLDPTLMISDSLNELTRFVRFTRPPTFVHHRTDTFSMANISLREVC